jgi:hypothetical protein
VTAVSADASTIAFYANDLEVTENDDGSITISPAPGA